MIVAHPAEHAERGHRGRDGRRRPGDHHRVGAVVPGPGLPAGRADLGPRCCTTRRTSSISAPHWAIFPGLLIFLTVLSINYIGDGLRDALDPRKTH